MTEQSPIQPATVPEQPEAKAPVRKGMPVVIALVVILGLIGLANRIATSLQSRYMSQLNT